MSEPLVVCICLTKDRPDMLKRAVRSFRAQTYQRKHLLVWDTGKETPVTLPENESFAYDLDLHSIGQLRNRANTELAYRVPEYKIIAHFDDDDWSHPERLSEQVALLQASGKEAVGYCEMLFWRTVKCIRHGRDSCPDCTDRGLDGETWLYSHGRPEYCLGTSLMYWRRVWERRPFEDLAHGEDYAWLKGVDSLGVPSVGATRGPGEYEPPMIATIHGGNTSPAYQYLEACEKQGEKWRRVPAWDDYCRKVLT